MSTLKQTLIFSFLFITIGLSAQNTDEYIIYTTNKNDIPAVNNVANLMNSTVLDYPDQEEHLALLKWDGQPFYYGSQYIDNIVNVVDAIKGSENSPPVIDIDGSGINFHYTPPANGNGGSSNCTVPYSEVPIDGARVTVGIFDTGLNYVKAQDYGYSFNDVFEIGDIEDTNGHGTHIGTVIDGIFHDRIDNDLSYVIGSPFNGTGGASIYGLIASIEEAITQYPDHIDIINFSFTYPYMSAHGTPEADLADGDPFFELLSAPEHSDILFVCAAGNDGYDIDGEYAGNGIEIVTIPSYYPGAFNLPNLISVGSYQCSQGTISKSSFSNYGTQSIDFAAEGEHVYGLDHNANLVWMSGTSQATAVTTGAAAAIKAKWPELTAEELKCIMINLGLPVAGFDQYFKNNTVLNLDFVLSLKNLPNCLEAQGNEGVFGLNIGSTNATQNHLTTFPNPFDNELNVDYFAEFNSPISFDIFTINGQLVHSYTENASKGNNKFVINFNNIVFSNQYILRITSNDKTETKKINRF